MPNDWNPEIYQSRAKQWEDKAAALPPGDERQACEALAQGYTRLAQLIEQAKKGAFSEPPAATLLAAGIRVKAGAGHVSPT
jgi:hypothetical protein